ncbi:hypothetical protein MKW98_030679 [Papaver atlanticum]|uniref:KIB1-4 beta-propeller domain-containing protein n=1 Tax=Papaver atlanticum TaxID=357466 RepID=A0AAD4RTY2_9MAGN|nr:hypothetical protein MKW98_030679 [Papaver atlanticum]
MDKQVASVAVPAERSERQRPPVPKVAPWLVFPHGKGRKFQSFYNPCEPNNRNCIKSIPEMRGIAYYHKPSHQGWLIVIGNVKDNTDQYSVANSNLDDCFLWNPVSSDTIHLPKLDRSAFTTKYESKNYFLRDLVLSSPPLPSTSNADQDDDCTVFLLFRGVDAKGEVCNTEHILVFCRPGDKQWRIKGLYKCSSHQDGWSGWIESLLCLKGKLYARNWLREIEIKKLWHNVGVENDALPVIGGGEKYDFWMEHWLESGNEIFRVYFNCSPRGYRKVASIHILKLDFSSMTWVLLKSLGDHVLFLGTNMDTCTTDVDLIRCYSTSSACCSAADMGLQRGCLFYTLPEYQTLYVYEVGDSATTVILPCLKLPTPWFLPTWIMIPTTENSKDETQTSINHDQEENTSRLNYSEEVTEALKHKDFLSLYDSAEAIARFLHPVDYIHFRVACKQHSIILPALNRISASTRTTTNTYLSPWMISIFDDDEETIWEMVDPMHDNDKYLLKLSDHLLVGARIRFSKNGWLLLSSGKNIIFFYNPFTRATIGLPDLPDGFTLGGMSFSSLPTSPDCVVIAISNWRPWNGESYINFLATEPGKSATGWTTHEFIYESIRGYMHEFMPCINNPVFYKGDFYCLDYNGLLGVFSAKGDDFSWKVLSKSLKQFSGIYPSFLVECVDKLLLVNLGQSGKSIEIYRLGESKTAWVELKSLVKQALFISYTSSFSAVAPRSCMENKIYFPRLYGERILYYSLDTCRYHCVGNNERSLQDFHNTTERSNCTWIEPNWSQAKLNQEPEDIMLAI